MDFSGYGCDSLEEYIDDWDDGELFSVPYPRESNELIAEDEAFAAIVRQVLEEMEPFTESPDDDYSEAYHDAYKKAYAELMYLFSLGINKRHETESGKYTPMLAPMPVCNPNPKIGSRNLGWTQGVLADGIPFVAELWDGDNCRVVSIILPFQERLMPDWQGMVCRFQVAGQEDETEEEDYGFLAGQGVLAEGMGLLDEYVSSQRFLDHIRYLEEMNIIKIPGIYITGGIQVLEDYGGNTVVIIEVSLELDGQTEGETSLKFRPFEEWRGTGNQE